MLQRLGIRARPSIVRTSLTLAVSEWSARHSGLQDTLTSPSRLGHKFSLINVGYRLFVDPSGKERSYRIPRLHFDEP